MHGFEVEREVHSSATSKVFRAVSRETGSRVALKIPVDTRESGIRRFAAEAAILSELSHPAMVRYVSHGGEGDDLFLAMQWLEGETILAQLRRARYGVATSVAIAKRVAEGLASAHGAGVVHRDVKPANVILENGEPHLAQLIDFGIAHRSSPEGLRKHASFSGGTWAYMSPEQVMGAAELGYRTDVYSLGCVLFECLTGKSPFPPDRAGAVMARIWKPVPRVSELCPAVPPALDALTARMMAQDPLARPSDGREVAEAVARLSRLTDDVLAVRQVG
ncbi:MAG TPA: serine/threonine-protein kinase [Polyangiaceae bacterium]|nr:serine/threonine-protein kinase [Polyangiaceae bacterium]